jgi:putative ABC transport system permease protein
MTLLSFLPSILLRTSLRYLLRHPWQIGLCVLGVALGVAVVVSIDLANASASRAFTLSTETIAGRATHQIVGGADGLPESLYRRLRVGLGLRQSAPIVEGYVQSPTMEDSTLQLFGVDPLAEAPFRAYLDTPGSPDTSEGDDLDLTTLMVEPTTVVMLEQTAQRYGLQPGDTLTLEIGSQQQQVRLVGLLRPRDDLSRRVLEGTLVADIATAQELLGMVGRLSRIDLIVPEPPQEAQRLAQIEAALPPGAELTRPEARSDALQQMTRAFELNLAALSLLALIVGVFLIYNTMTFSVVQRRELFGTLRCLGATRRQVLALVLLEAAFISLAGTLLGLLMGMVLGRGLVRLVTRTINDLYFVVTVRELAIDPLVLLKGFALGIVATLLAAAVPAIEAMLSPPRTVQRRSSAEERIRRAVPWTGAAGGGLLLLSLLLMSAGGRNGWLGLDAHASLISAHTALFMIVIGFALLTPAVTVLLMRLLHPVLGWLFGLLGRMAARDVEAALSRTSVAIASLMVAISVTIGVGIMVGSFRQTVISWLDQSLIADIYVASPGNNSNRTDTAFAPEVVEPFAQHPGVADITRFRNQQVQTTAGPVLLVAVDRADRFRNQMPLELKQASAEPLRDFDAGAVFISEPLAYRAGLGVGDVLRLPTEQGEQAFPIAAVYYDYTTDRGVIRMEYDTYRTYWDDPAISSFAIYAAPGVDVDQLVADLREQAAGGRELAINSNQGIKTDTLVVFDRTFAITSVLQMLATIVAFIGVLSALMALQLERARELAMLRANGLTPRQVWGVVLSQTSLMGLTAGLLAMPVGVVLALVLVFVINRRSFGWTLNLSIDPLLLVQALLVAVAAALLAGIYPALRMGRTNPALALREE